MQSCAALVLTTVARTTVIATLAGDLLVELANRAPVKDDFHFASIEEGLTVRGTYVLQYEVQPCLPGLPALTSCTIVTVAAGQPISLELQVWYIDFQSHLCCSMHNVYASA